MGEINQRTSKHICIAHGPHPGWGGRWGEGGKWETPAILSTVKLILKYINKMKGEKVRSRKETRENTKIWGLKVLILKFRIYSKCDKCHQ